MLRDKNGEWKVSSRTPTQKLGGAIAYELEREGKLILRAMGEASVNSAVKGIIVSQSFLAARGFTLHIGMGFDTMDDPDLHKEVTVIKFYLRVEH